MEMFQLIHVLSLIHMHLTSFLLCLSKKKSVWSVFVSYFKALGCEQGTRSAKRNGKQERIIQGGGREMGKQHMPARKKRVMSEEESGDEKKRKGGSLSMLCFPQYLWVHEHCRNDCAECVLPSGSSEYITLCQWHPRRVKLAVTVCPMRTIKTSWGQGSPFSFVSRSIWRCR